MLLTIITPVYNGGGFIAQCIENVLQQENLNVEHLIIDGNSLDDTIEIVRRYSASNPRIRWISEDDEGQSEAMNKGIALAKGKIIGVLNVDDFYEKGALNEVCWRFKKLPEPSLLVGNCNVFGSENRLLGVNKPRRLDLVHLLVGDDVLYPFPVNPSAYFYHKSLHEKVGLYDAREHYVLDTEFLLRAIPKANTYYVDRVLGNFRYIDGTKTFEDAKKGTATARFRNLLNRYRQQLSIRQKSHLCLLRLESVTIGFLRMVLGPAARVRNAFRAQPIK